MDDEGEWSRRAQDVWGAWSRDPVTALWGSADIAYALDTIRLVDMFARSKAISLMAEVRLRMDGLGLSPKGRQSLRWRLVDGAEEVASPRSPNRSRSGRRRRLTAVDPPGVHK